MEKYGKMNNEQEDLILKILDVFLSIKSDSYRLCHTLFTEWSCKYNWEYQAVSWHRYFQFTEGKFGVPDKCDVGLLAWYSDTNTNRMLKVGFMVKCICLFICKPQFLYNFQDTL